MLNQYGSKLRKLVIGGFGVEVRRSWVWEAVIKRVYAIGAYLLRLGLYAEVPLLIRQPVTWEVGHWRRSFWARHALTMRSRDGGLTRQGLCAVAEDYVERREWFYGEFGEDKDDLISALPVRLPPVRPCHRSRRRLPGGLPELRRLLQRADGADHRPDLEGQGSTEGTVAGDAGREVGRYH